MMPDQFSTTKKHRVTCQRCGHLDDCYSKDAAITSAQEHIEKESENYQSQPKGRRQGPEFHVVEIQKIWIVEKD